MKKYQGIYKILFLLVLLPFVAWHLAIQKTVELHEKCQEQQQMLTQLPDVKESVSANHTTTSGQALISNGKILQLIHDSLSVYHVDVIGFTPKKIDSEKEYTLYNGELLLSGNYIGLVEVINAIEQLNLPIKIRSADFSYNKQKKEYGKAVRLALVLQQIESAS